MSPIVNTDVYSSSPARNTSRPFPVFFSFFSLGAVFLFIVVLVTGGIIGLSIIEKNTIENLENQIAEQQAALELSRIHEMSDFDQRMITTSRLFGTHMYASAALDVLEYVTLRDVRYNSFSHDAVARTLTLTAEAKSDTVFAEQMDALRSSGFFSDVRFSAPTINTTTQTLRFNLALRFADDPRNIVLNAIGRDISDEENQNIHNAAESGT